MAPETPRAHRSSSTSSSGSQSGFSVSTASSDVYTTRASSFASAPSSPSFGGWSASVNLNPAPRECSAPLGGTRFLPRTSDRCRRPSGGRYHTAFVRASSRGVATRSNPSAVSPSSTAPSVPAPPPKGLRFGNDDDRPLAPSGGVRPVTEPGGASRSAMTPPERLSRRRRRPHPTIYGGVPSWLHT